MTIHGIRFVRSVEQLRHYQMFTGRTSVEEEAARVRPEGGWVYFDGHGVRHKQFIPSAGPQSAEDLRHAWPQHQLRGAFWILMGTDGYALVPEGSQERQG